jgi:hypothetical protein
MSCGKGVGSLGDSLKWHHCRFLRKIQKKTEKIQKNLKNVGVSKKKQQFQIQQFLGPQLVTAFEHHPRRSLRAMGAKSLQD